MLSGAPDNQPPPIKPWEISSSHGSPENNFAPPPPSAPLSFPANQDPFSSNNSMPYGSGGYYGGGYANNRFGYSASYTPGFSNYNYPYYGTNGSFGGSPPAPGSYITSSLENTTRPLFDSLNHVLQAINHVSCFIDSTVFAVWTSVTAAGSIVTAIKTVKNVYLRQFAEYLKKSLQKLKESLKSSSGRKRLILLISVATSIPFLLKALHAIFNFDNDAETSLILRSQSDESDFASKSDEDSITSKVAFVRALYSFESIDKNTYLNLSPGDVILVSKTDEAKIYDSSPTWIAGKLKNGSSGFFPSNYVTVIK